MIRRTAALAALLAGAAGAETDFRALTGEERAAFRAELRAVLLAHPEIVQSALAPAPYADEIAKDEAIIARHSETLFGAHDFAFIGPPGDALEELAALSAEHGLSFARHRLGDLPALAAALELTEPPFYIFGDVIYRGTMPAIVLERELSRMAGEK